MAGELTIEQFGQKTKLFLSVINNELPKINEICAVTALSILKQRIIDDGIGANGASLGSYSPSYVETRKKNNKQTNHVDLKFTGDMWRDIDVISSELKGDTAVTVVTAKNAINRGKLKTEDIMFNNAERYGDFMALSPEEEEQVASVFDKELQKVIDKIFENG